VSKFDTHATDLKWDGTHIWNRERNRVRHIYPGRSPYKPRPRYLHEVTGLTRQYRYCIADRDDLPVLLFTTYAEAQNVSEHVNVNMAKEVLS
jgi:hypothetical protein